MSDTTNAIESLNMQLRKIIKTRGHSVIRDAAEASTVVLGLFFNWIQTALWHYFNHSNLRAFVEELGGREVLSLQSCSCVFCIVESQNCIGLLHCDSTKVRAMQKTLEVSSTRIEHDLQGERDIPNEAYWGFTP